MISPTANAVHTPAQKQLLNEITFAIAMDQYFHFLDVTSWQLHSVHQDDTAYEELLEEVEESPEQYLQINAVDAEELKQWQNDFCQLYNLKCSTDNNKGFKALVEENNLRPQWLEMRRERSRAKAWVWLNENGLLS